MLFQYNHKQRDPRETLSFDGLVACDDPATFIEKSNDVDANVLVAIEKDFLLMFQ